VELSAEVGNPKLVLLLPFVVLEDDGTVKAHATSVARRSVRRRREKRDSFLDRVLTRERGIYWSYRYAMILEVKQME
jgi:hypothetical protein